MTQEANPSILAISIVFGGVVGMTATALLGLDPGGGFVIGSAFVFLVLSIAVMLSRELEIVALVGLLKSVNIGDFAGLDMKKMDRRQLSASVAELLQAILKLQQAIRDGDKVRRS